MPTKNISVYIGNQCILRSKPGQTVFTDGFFGKYCTFGIPTMDSSVVITTMNASVTDVFFVVNICDLPLPMDSSVVYGNDHTLPNFTSVRPIYSS